MATVRRNYAAGNHVRLRLLACIVEASQDRPPTDREIQTRIGISYGGLAHHVNVLIQQGYLERAKGARSLRVTKQGNELLIYADLIKPTGVQVVYGLTATGMQLLEEGDCRE